MTYQIYVINMSSSSDRFNYISQQLEQQNLSFKRIPGVDIKERQDLKNKYYSKVRNKLGYHKTLTDGEIGCYIAHRNAWKAILDDNIDFGLVLEDDAYLKENLKLILDNLHNTKSDWDILKLADLSTSPRKGTNIEKFQKFDIQSYYKPPTLCIAEVITRKGAKILLNLSNTFGRPVDVDKQWFCFKGLKIKGIKPYPVNCNNQFKSEIDSIQNRKYSLSFKERFIRRLKRIKLNIIYKIKLLRN